MIILGTRMYKVWRMKLYEKHYGIAHVIIGQAFLAWASIMALGLSLYEICLGYSFILKSQSTPVLFHCTLGRMWI
jgi:hypothetical protein